MLMLMEFSWKNKLLFKLDKQDVTLRPTRRLLRTVRNDKSGNMGGKVKVEKMDWRMFRVERRGSLRVVELE